MLIICAGPDTYRAREKALELELAFRKKYDPDGRSIEHVDIFSAEHVRDRLYPLLSVGSLFSTRKFIRVDGCLSVLKAAERKKCMKRLAGTNDETIIVTLETDPPTKKMIESSGCPLLYSYPVIKGREFVDWCMKKGAEIGVENECSEKVANFSNGDTWLAITELQKYSAFPHQAIGTESLQTQEAKIFEITDAILRDQKGWRTRVDSFNDEGVVTTALSQLRSHSRIKAGYAEDVHPYVQQKLSRLKIENFHKKFMFLLRAHVSRRKGLIEGKEHEAMI